jgi:large subunit ribosomal protein L25
MYQCLKVESRTDSFENKPSSLRREGWIPGVIFGKEIDSVTLKVKENELKKFLNDSGAVFQIEVAGTKHLCNLDDLQRDALGAQTMHVSFHKLKAGQKTTVNVPIHYIGEAPGIKAGGILNLLVDNLDLEGLPKDIPEFVEVDLSGVEVDGQIHLGDVKTPKGCDWTIAPETNLLSCHLPKVVVEEPVDEVAAAAAASGEAPAAVEAAKE